MEINRIHYVIHPLWNLDLNREGVLNLVDNLLPIIDAEGKLDDRLIIFHPNDTSHYVDVSSNPFFPLSQPNLKQTYEQERERRFKETMQRIQRDYETLTPRLMDAVSNCKNYFVGRASRSNRVPTGRVFVGRGLRAGQVYQEEIDEERFSPKFREYLVKNTLNLGDGSINQDGNLIIGHGSDRDACVVESCGGLVEAIKTELGNEVSFDVNEKTTL